MYIFGPRSGLTRKSGRRETRFKRPSRFVYSGNGSACIRSLNCCGRMSLKSSPGGQSFNFSNIGVPSSSTRRSVNFQQVLHILMLILNNVQETSFSNLFYFSIKSFPFLSTYKAQRLLLLFVCLFV